MEQSKRDRTLSSSINNGSIDTKTNYLLQSVIKCSDVLLQNKDFNLCISQGLEILGQSIGADRLEIYEHCSDTATETQNCAIAEYKWFSSAYQLHHPHRISYKELTEERDRLLSGDSVGGSIDTYPEPFRSQQKNLGVKAIYAIPITIEEQYWGFIGIDFYQTAVELASEEIAVLKTAATLIGSAIQRERNRQVKELARDRLLKITANVAQTLLNYNNLDKAIAIALKIVGEGIDTDRVSIMEHCSDFTGSSLGSLQILYEWHSPHAASQLLDRDLQKVSYEGIEAWYESWQRQEAVGGITEKLSEPIRSAPQKLGVKSFCAVPIIMNEQYWGVLGFDDCREVKQRSESEISILKAIASCLGSAIQHRIAHQKKPTEQTPSIDRQKVTQLSEYNSILEQRNNEVQQSYRILSATAEVANILLTGNDFDAAVNQALCTLGQTIDADRVLVVEHWHNPLKPSLPHWKISYEWHSAYVKSQLFSLEVSQGSYAGIEEWYEILGRGQNISCLLADIPEPFRSIKAQIGVKVLNIVPIFIASEYWGVVAINDCRKEVCRSGVQLNVVKIAAACIGGAIEQERIRRAKKEAERKILLEREQAAIEKALQLQKSNKVLSLRDKWLEATANAANKLLEIADLEAGINAALTVLGTSLSCDRICIMECTAKTADVRKQFVYQRYEWNSEATVSQINHSKFYKISALGMEEAFVQIIAGKYVGGPIDEFPEPFRSERIEVGVKSTYAVPIFTNEYLWGVLSIDFCREAKLLILSEIAVFRTAASCIGSAIYRQQIQQEKQQAELAILDERNRMAREIHDTLAQAFTGISLQLEVAKNILITQPEAAQQRLLQAKNLAKEGVSEARRSVRALRPEVLESGNLVTALHQLLDKMLSGTKINSRIIIEGRPLALSSETEGELFRIAQEALTNTLRYAEVSEISIQLIYEIDTLYFSIEDNGVGFDPQLSATRGFGLIGMQERCDRLHCNLIIDSAIGKGTKIVVIVPL